MLQTFTELLRPEPAMEPRVATLAQTAELCSLGSPSAEGLAMGMSRLFLREIADPTSRRAAPAGQGVDLR
jgi:hypothetical protein